MAEFDPFGQWADARYRIVQMRQQKEQNALSQALQQAQLDKYQQGNQEERALAGILQGLAQPQQTGGPLRGAGSYQPVQMEQQPVTRQRLFDALMKAGNTKALDYMPEQGKPQIFGGESVGYYEAVPGSGQGPRELVKGTPKAQLSGEAKNLAEMLGRMPTVEEMKEYLSRGKEASSYFTPVQTSTGILKFNNRTGQMEPITQDGRPVLPVSADVDLAGGKKYAEVTGKERAEKDVFYPKAKAALSGLNRKWDTVDKNIDKAMKNINWFTTGPASKLAVIPGSAQRDLQATLDTVRANIGFDQLQQMRDNSPTGGALGQVSEMENRLLQSVQGSLDQNQSPEQLLENLQNIKENLAALRKEKQQAFNADFGSGGAKTKAPTEMSNDELLKALGVK